MHQHLTTLCVKNTDQLYIPYSDSQNQETHNVLDALQPAFVKPIITQVLPFKSFKANKGELLNYLYKSPNKPFCKTYIHPKLRLLLTRFKHHVNDKKLALCIPMNNQASISSPHKIDSC